MRRVVAAIIVAAASVANAHAADDFRESTERFFKRLACRNAQVLGGQNDIGAILYHDPAYDRPKERGRFGTPVYYLNQAVQPLGVFRILPRGKNGDRSRVRMVFSSNGNILAVFDYINRGAETGFYWSPTDDLVVWNLDELWWADGGAIRSGFPFLFERISTPELGTTITYGRADAIPEHFNEAAKLVIWNSAHHIPEFDPHTRKVQESLTRLGDGLRALFSHDQLAWTQSEVFVRLTKANSTNPTHLELLSPDNTTGFFAPQTFSHNAKLLLVRDNRQLRIPEALLLWRDNQSVSHIGMVRLGSSTPTIVAKDYIRKVFLSPDRTKIYGYSDHAGRFRPLLSEQHKSSVAFWLGELKQMDGVEEFYLLDKERYAVIKRSGGTRGPEAIILERRGSTTARLDNLCQTNSPVERILEGPSALLFIPKASVDNKLVVYLRDGPFHSVGRSGDWITDVVTQTGTPVLAIDYFGSSTRTRELAVARDIAPMFAKDIEDAVVFARRHLPPGNEREIIFLAQGFGTFAGFASIAAEAVSPNRFLSLSGMVDARRIFSDHRPDRDPFELNYLSRAGRQLGTVIAPAAATKKDTRFLFIHGDKDDTAAYADVVQFTKRLNETADRRLAEISIVPEMGHLPETRKDYEAVIAAIETFLRAP